jgi:hypothetical protein
MPRTPSGEILAITGLESGQLFGQWGFTAWLNGHLGLKVSTGVVGSFEGIEAYTGRLATYRLREVSALGGQLIAFESNELTMFLWKGAQHELLAT